MDINVWLLLAIFVVGMVGLGGFLRTKKQGFGPFNTSTLLLLLVVIITAMLYVAGKCEPQMISNIFFAVVGFAGGLFTQKTEERAQPSAPADVP